MVVDFETKNKHKVKVLQVERGVPEEVSYRLDDLKTGRVAVGHASRSMRPADARSTARDCESSDDRVVHIRSDQLCYLMMRKARCHALMDGRRPGHGPGKQEAGRAVERFVHYEKGASERRVGARLNCCKRQNGGSTSRESDAIGDATTRNSVRRVNIGMSPVEGVQPSSSSY